jgi:hypothetical protein
LAGRKVPPPSARVRDRTGTAASGN